MKDPNRFRRLGQSMVRNARMTGDHPDLDLSRTFNPGAQFHKSIVNVMKVGVHMEDVRLLLKVLIAESRAYVFMMEGISSER